ncbi:MAG: hypothetical protein MRY83_04510 [Flavobacteriales bacterium]|nr:hypothetical protein [Flavobacteriales bacterium]
MKRIVLVIGILPLFLGAQDYQDGVNFLTEEMTLGIYQLQNIETSTHDTKCGETREKLSVAVANNEKWFNKAISKNEGKSFLAYHKNMSLSEQEYETLKNCALLKDEFGDTSQVRMALERGIRKFQVTEENASSILTHFRIIPEDNQILIGALTLYYQRNPASFYEKFRWDLQEIHTWYGEKKLNSGGAMLKETYTVKMGRSSDKSLLLNIEIKSPEGAKVDNSGSKTWKLSYLRDR